MGGSKEADFEFGELAIGMTPNSRLTVRCSLVGASTGGAGDGSRMRVCGLCFYGRYTACESSRTALGTNAGSLVLQLLSDCRGSGPIMFQGLIAGHSVL